jgi:hypothetical protein
LEECPYSANYGEVGATWTTIMQKCNALCDKKGQNLQNVPLRSGCDDEKPSDLLLLLYKLKEDCRIGVEESKKRRDQRRFMATKKEAGRAAAIKLKDKSVKKFELKTIQGGETDGISSSEVECRFQQKQKAASTKEKYIEWKMNEAALDREQAALDRAQKQS